MKNIWYIISLLFSFESLEKKIEYVSPETNFIPSNFYKLKTFNLLTNSVSPYLEPSNLFTYDINLLQNPNYILIKALYVISFKLKFCHTSKNKAIINYFKFFFFLSRKNPNLSNNVCNLFEEDIYLETLAINNLYNIYQIEQFY